jgi:hypothetical protein
MKSPLKSYKLDTLRGHPMRHKEGANQARDTVPLVRKPTLAQSSGASGRVPV